MRKDHIMLNAARVWLRHRHTPVAHNLPWDELIDEGTARPQSSEMTATFVKVRSRGLVVAVVVWDDSLGQRMVFSCVHETTLTSRAHCGSWTQE